MKPRKSLRLSQLTGEIGIKEIHQGRSMALEVKKAQRNPSLCIPRESHHAEVFGPARRASELAGEQHVFNVVARSIIELPHVEVSWLEEAKVCFALENLHHAFFHQVSVPDLMSVETDTKIARVKSEGSKRGFIAAMPLDNHFDVSGVQNKIAPH